MMTAQELQTKQIIETQLSELLAGLKGEQGREIWDRIEAGYLQQLLAVLIKMYVSRVRSGEEVAPVEKAELGETETAVFVDALLKCMDIELFEMQIWRSLGSNY